MDDPGSSGASGGASGVASGGSPSWTRADVVLLCILVLGAGASLVWLVHPWFDALNDAAIYLLTAKSLAAGEGYTYLGEPFIIRPPGFSALLAPLIAWRGIDFLAVNLFVSAWGVLALALLFVWSRARLGSLLAACVAICVWLNPGWRQMCNQAMSDIPGAALLLACLLLERWARRAPSALRDGILGLVIGLSSYVRLGIVLLVPAILLQRAIEWRKGGDSPKSAREPWTRFHFARMLVPAAVAVLAVLPWKIHEARFHPTPPADQTSLYSYSTAMWHVDRGDPSSPRCSLAEILARVPKRAGETLSTLGSRLEGSDSSPAHILLGAAALALALWLLLRENRVEGWLLVATIALLLVYFDFRDRLVLPIHLLVLPALVEAAVRAGRSLARERRPLAGESRSLAGELWARRIAAALVLLLALCDFAPRRGWKEMEESHRAFQETSRALSVRLPADARLAAPFASWRYSVYLGRPVYTLFFAWVRRGDMSGAEEILDKYRIDRVLLSPTSDADLKMAPYFEQRYGIADRIGDVAIVRVR